MTRARTLSILAIAFLILILGVGAAAWWYLFGPNKVEAAELVPGDTIFFASIPNAATIVTGYQTSQLKQLVDSPNSQPISDSITKTIGQKNIELFNSFAPNLSGQSFFAITHFDISHPEQIGIIAGLKPKAGMGSFDTFLTQLKASYPDILKQGTTGTGNVLNVDYQWLKGPGASDKICVAQVKGWIITTWGEATLQDWIIRFRKQSVTPSLAQNPDYQKSIARVGKDPMTLLYVDYHALIDLAQKQIAKTNPANSDYMLKKFGSIGGLALGTRFEDGNIVDRFSLMMPKQGQIDAGMTGAPCPFETLKFTGPATRLYWASSLNWQQYWKNMEEQAAQGTPPNPMATGLVNSVNALAQNNGLDLHKNIIDPLGDEMSVQLEWNDDSTYPELGLFLKIAKPDDFKPTITALIETARKMYSTSAVINELESGGQKFAELKFVQSTPVTFTITETGPYFGIFTSENMAARSYVRIPDSTLDHQAPFISQIGDKRNGADQIAFVDTPHLIDRTYRTALPYVSLASMFNKDIAAFLQGKNLPNDLTWLAPMGTWSLVMSADDAGVQGYSVSGIGNQGILLALTGGGAMVTAQTMGLLPKMSGANTNTLPVNPAPPLTPAVITPMPTPGNPTPAPTTLPPTTPAPLTPAAPDATTTTPPPAAPSTDSAPAATNSPAQDAPK